ncbi:MAG: sugar ABC transporter ATP-binding protein [Sphingobacteriaceae bacterium]|nr:sugar ABC transporter ATP-binding protein [Cytophagaceae bacterium]
MKLHLQTITKTFPGVRALDGVSLGVEAGEVHALCGENGAGKSTLMNILAGNLQPDPGGEIVLDGQVVSIPNPQRAAELGIAIVYQERSLADNLSVAENIFANQPPTTRLGLIDYPKLNAEAGRLLDELQIGGISPKTPVERLSPGQKQMVEIAKALSKNPQILILDEPTASLTERETAVLFGVLRLLRERGVAIIYISHRMEEIYQLADRITVLKDGRWQATKSVAELPPDALIRLMVGRDLHQSEGVSSKTNEVLLSVENLSGGRFNAISFTLHRGEVLGLAGLVGAGRSEIARAIFGADPVFSGKIKLNGETYRANHPAEAIRRGIGYVPEERKTSGVFLEMPISENVVSADLHAAVSGRWFSEKKAAALAEDFRQKLRIVTPSIRQKAVNLSGGNQQKVVLARWLLTNPDVLIVDEPTHGIDVGAKFEVYQLLRQLAAEGKGILLISSELPELLALSDTVVVIHQGRVAGQLSRAEASEERVLALASGMNT